MDFSTLLSDYGLPGIIITVQSSVVVFLYRENRQLIKQLFDQQEARRVESLETAKELNNTLKSFSDSTSLLVDKIKIVRGEKS